jgi:ABC-type sugar transport system permease subunit
MVTSRTSFAFDRIVLLTRGTFTSCRRTLSTYILTMMITLLQHDQSESASMLSFV